MDRFYAANVASIATSIPYPGNYGFVQGNELLPQFYPTSPSAFWYYWLTESIRNVIVAAGLTPDPQNLNQFYQAIQLLSGG